MALSTTEAEYIALAEAFKEALYLSKLMKEFDGEVPEDGIIVFEDNTACGQWAKNEGLDHSKTKHIDIRTHFIRDHVKKHDVNVTQCPTQEMVADCMTKPLKPDLHSRTVGKTMGKSTQMTDDGIAWKLNDQINWIEKQDVHILNKEIPDV